MSGLRVLDVFSAAAGGWSLGLHRAGFKTVAACESVAWRRVLYAQNNPGVLIYDDVCTLTADRLVRDIGYLPDVVVGSPPCQDISSANTKGKGVEGERSGLYFEAIRIIGEVRPRWFALENSSNLRTRGADAVLAALEAIGYACWSYVVRAGHGRGGAGIGANHERPRSWLIGCDLSQVANASSWEQRQQPRRGNGQDWSGSTLDGDHDPAIDAADANGHGRDAGRQRWRRGFDLSVSNDPIGPGHVCKHGIRWPWACDECDAAADALGDRRYPWPGLPGQDERNQPTHDAGHAAEDGCGQGRQGRRVEPIERLSVEACRDDANTAQERSEGQSGSAWRGREGEKPEHSVDDVADADGHGQPDSAVYAEVGGCAGTGFVAPEPWAEWNSGLAGHLRVDDGLSAWVAGTRIAVGGPLGTSAASLIVEAFGDAVVPQIPEAIGRAILRTEQALAAVYARSAA
ncbi:DNA (cytosine-5)-methyltransferase 1 [Aminobacter aminovorans]|uniref:Modification methylase HaeIII n=1 Tax=Aminobacter aminovorans TaxID=83263 RepID=A0A380WKV6_AMIAI|nr:DNA cytosine methyltransferase [Aminobacter aminovorans]TCS28224.1 DNA (cytosine-5)-methyltransferase 1 [Aminobacter aminovorans]SUU89365.1 Modification methylase HaeIII [Aminobacter aminovorans]